MDCTHPTMRPGRGGFTCPDCGLDLSTCAALTADDIIMMLRDGQDLATIASECAVTRERSVAGRSNIIPDCPMHGAAERVVALVAAMQVRADAHGLSVRCPVCHAGIGRWCRIDMDDDASTIIRHDERVTLAHGGCRARRA